MTVDVGTAVCGFELRKNGFWLGRRLVDGQAVYTFRSNGSNNYLILNGGIPRNAEDLIAFANN